MQVGSKAEDSLAVVALHEPGTEPSLISASSPNSGREAPSGATGSCLISSLDCMRFCGIST